MWEEGFVKNVRIPSYGRKESKIVLKQPAPLRFGFIFFFIKAFKPILYVRKKKQFFRAYKLDLKALIIKKLERKSNGAGCLKHSMYHCVF